MTAPSRLHQKIILKLGNQIDQYLDAKPCEVYPAPFNVRLPSENEADEAIETTIEPDLSIICDPDKLDDKGCRGAHTPNSHEKISPRKHGSQKADFHSNH